MQSADRFKLGAKGAVLWVLAALLVGVLASALFRGEATLGFPWIAAAVGLLGGLAHFLVAITKAHPDDIKSTVAAVTGLATALAVLALYWITGSRLPTQPEALAAEAFRAVGYLLLPIAVTSYLVLRLVQAKSAA